MRYGIFWLLGMTVGCGNPTSKSTSDQAKVAPATLSTKIHASIFLADSASSSASELFPLTVVGTGDSAKSSFTVTAKGDESHTLVIKGSDLGKDIDAVVLLPKGFSVAAAEANGDMLHYSLALPAGSALAYLESYEPFSSASLSLSTTPSRALLNIAKTQAYAYLTKLGINPASSKNTSLVSDVVALFTTSETNFESSLSQGGSIAVLTHQVMNAFQNLLTNDTSFRASLVTAVAAQATSTAAGAAIDGLVTDNHTTQGVAANGPAQVVTGHNHTCLLRGNGSAWCWGNNYYGQLGVGSVDNQSSPTVAVNLGVNRTATQLAAGKQHTCALLDNGTVTCWGMNQYGQLGDGTNTDSHVPAHAITFGAGRTALQITTGAYHSCARLDNGVLQCWGYNSNGSLGIGNKDSQSSPVTANVGQGRTVTQVTAGDFTTCAILDNTALVCAGWNNKGQIGNGSTTDQTSLTPISLGTGRYATQIAAGVNHTCALLDNKTLKCWGSSTVGQLGYGDNTSRPSPPEATVNFGTGRYAIQLSVLYMHTCALLDDHTTRCWGRNESGQLGLGNQTDQTSPPTHAIDLGASRTSVQVAAGESHSCAILDNGTLKCWGGNTYGQLGLGDLVNRGGASTDMGDHLVSITLPTVTETTTTTATNTSTTTSTSTTATDTHTNTGTSTTTTTTTTGTNTDTNPPTDVSVAFSTTYTTSASVSLTLAATHAYQMYVTNAAGCGSGGSWETYATSKSGWTLSPDAYHFATVYVKYRSEGNTESACVNASIAYIQPQIVAGDTHACAILSNATVKCWGHNDHGKLGQTLGANIGDGIGPSVADVSPLSFGASRVAVQLTAGSAHACALLDNHSVQCWGNNSDGQLGVGDTTDRQTPTTVTLPAGKSVAQITTGIEYTKGHTCALFTDGTVSCWGGNTYGQLGLGNTDPLNAPSSTVNLGAGRTATQIAAGGDHTCAVLDNGTLSCWGYNGTGELGQGNTSNSLVPIMVSLGSGFVPAYAVASYGVSCAWTSGGASKCWGYNPNGQLGQGNTIPIGDGSGHPSVASISAINVGTELTVSQMAISGSSHTCALLSSNGVKCWGNNNEGELGLGSQINLSSPGSAINFGGSYTARQVAAGGQFSCALLNDNSVKCWGVNYEGELGQGNMNPIGDGVGVSVATSSPIVF